MNKKVIYDIGLHKGEDTEYYLERGFDVVAIEADPDLVAYCNEKFKKYIDSKALTIIHGAVIEDENCSSITFYKNQKKSVWGTVDKQWAERNSALGAESIEINVPVVEFKELFAEYGCPYYMKIDIEGMDLVCLKKLLLSDCRPKYVSLESEKLDLEALVEEFNTFDTLGYKKFFIQEQSFIDAQKVPTDSQEGRFVDHRFPSGSTGPFGSDLRYNWITREEALKRYTSIFRYYRWLGDDSFVRRMPLGRHLLYALSKAFRKPLPGWYDTHAMYE